MAFQLLLIIDYVWFTSKFGWKYLTGWRSSYHLIFTRWINYNIPAFGLVHLTSENMHLFQLQVFNKLCALDDNFGQNQINSKEQKTNIKHFHSEMYLHFTENLYLEKHDFRLSWVLYSTNFRNDEQHSWSSTHWVLP